MLKRLAIVNALIVLLVTNVGARDTLSVVGVAVRKTDGRRVPGVTVKLVASAAGVGLLAEDRTSAQGVFNLYTANIAGAIGDLYVVYDGTDLIVTPLKVTVGASRNGFIDLRPGDLLFLDAAAPQALTSEEASDQVAAVLQTQAVLLNAGMIDKAKFDQAVTARTTEIKRRVPPENAPTIENFTTDKIRNFKIPIDPRSAMVVIRGRGRLR